MKKNSIIIPVFNEEKLINGLLSNLLSITTGTNSEIIIADGHKSATTIHAIESSLLKSGNIKVIKAPLNKGNQMNAAVEHSEGDMLIFLHADSYLTEDAFKSIARGIKENIAGAFRLRLDSNRFRYRLIETFINLRTKLTNIPYGDQALFIRRDLFLDLNGFFSHPVMEDIDLIRRIKKKGVHINISEHVITTSCRRWEREGFLKCTLRNWFILFMYYMGTHPDKLKKYYHY